MATLVMGFALAGAGQAYAGDDEDQPASCHDNCTIIITDHVPDDAPTHCHDNCTVYATSIDDASCHDRCKIIDRDQDDHVSDEPGDCHNDCHIVGNVDGASCHDKCLIVGQHDEDDGDHHGDGSDRGHGSYGGGRHH
ncbi:MAG TPA: hypothetical protein VGF50_06755 [Caulobacteraceae bacterium]